MVDIIARLRLRGEEFSRASKSYFKDFEADADRSGRAAGASFGQGFSVSASDIITGATAAAIFALGKRSLDYAANLKKMSEQVGASTKDYQEFSYAARALGVEQDALDDSLKTLTERIGEARSGNKQASEAFRELGIDVSSADGQLKNATSTYDELIGRISGIQDPIERARLLSGLFGDEWQKVAPLLSAGKGEVDNLRRAAEDLGVVLSNEQIANADKTAQKLRQVQAVLEARVAGIVAENSQAIIALANAMGFLAQGANNAYLAVQGFYRLYKDQGLFQALTTGVADVARYGTAGGRYAALSKNLTDATASRRRLEQAGVHTRAEQQALAAALRKEKEAEALYRSARADLPSSRPSLPSARPIGLPQGRTVATGTAGTRAGGGGRASNDNSAAREAEKLRREYEQIDKWLKDTVEGQNEALRIEQLRAAQGDRIADKAEAIAALEKQRPELVGKTAAELAKVLGITEAQAKIELDLFEQAKKNAADAVDRKADAEDARARVEAERQAQEEIDRMRAQAAERQQRQIEDLAGFYRSAFGGATGDFWRDFKQMGIDTISYLAAQYTLATLTGKQLDFQSALGASLQASGSPLSLLLGSIGSSDKSGGLLKVGGDINFGKIFDSSGVLSASGKAGDITKSLVPVQTTGAGASGGLLGGAGGVAGALGAFGAAVAANQIIGDIFGFKGGPLGIFTGLISKTKKGSATLALDQFGALGVGSTRGNSKSRIAAASQGVGSVADALQSIADAVGADISGGGSVSLGVRKKSYVVDTLGQGRTKGAGVLNFGTDQEAAVRAAISEALRDSVVSGISDAAQRILQSGQQLEKAIEKAASIESIPKLLKARLDPLGAALDEVDRKFADLAKTLQEGGASADQIAQARQLWQLERDDTIKQIGTASQGLKDFLQALRIGSDSPLSLRDQEAAAKAALAPYEAQVNAALQARGAVDALDAKRAAGGTVSDAEYKAAVEAAAIAASKIDQEKYQETASIFLSIERQLNGTTTAFFQQYDRINAMTEGAISAIDKSASGAAAKDPFAELTAQNTGAMANILEQTNQLLSSLPREIAALIGGGGGGGGTFVGADRYYVRAA
ncbi:MAG: phage tail tape measure protein [Sphingobium sp.]|nr:phage tail tape measure protein [Sphingobium sp.]